MKTYHKNVDLFLVDGEVYITEPFEEGDEKTTHCTRQIEGTILLDISKFVKGVNLNELSKGFNMHSSSFKAGYNANKSEFTREEMELCWLQATRKAVDFNNEAGFTKFLSNIKPLFLPESITLNDNNEITEVIW